MSESADVVAFVVDQTLRAAGIPIVGVAIGNPEDRASWRVTFGANATNEQRAQAARILAVVAIDATTLADAALVARLGSDKLFRAVIVWMAGKHGLTAADARAEIVAEYKRL